MTSRILFSLLLLSTVGSLRAQPEADTWFYGFKAGATYHRIAEIGTTIIPDVFPQDSYSTEIAPQLGFAGGVVFYHRFYKSRFAIQPEILFASRGGDFNYSDVRDLEYSIGFNYQYLSLGGLIKTYPGGGLHFGVGAQVAFNVATDKLTYLSNMPELGPDLQIQQSLREVLVGSNDINVLLQAGYDFPFGLMVEARYVLGLKDVLETRANGFNFIENTNRSSGFQITLGWLIEFP
ncbi:porin family protein [Neolewinella lacunae]|uniref:PorT family protein n=1 Tax=Neolewinella lacunae TaxID=1517758 RepID=A0A923PMX8_9BACT|nr:porin family protein [Neolewinella lacunae]MBC6995661.1 PorT family protein [Neolewinella lacunae]MDN3634272.1 porin family protein [Neolewinella lacunae]